MSRPAQPAGPTHRARLAVGLILLAGAVLALALDWLLPNWPKIHPLPGEAAAGAVIGEGEWRQNALACSAPAAKYRLLANRGSSLPGDDYTGEHETGWYRAAPRAMVLVAGGPTRSGNQLSVEIRRADGRIETALFAGPEPGERWEPWVLPLATDTVAFRLKGVDGNTGFRGWLGFSEPFSLPIAQTMSWKMAAQILCAVALAVVLVFGPGLVFAGRHGRGPGLATLWLGPGLLVAGGAACWALGGVLPPRVIATGWVGATLLAVAFLGRKQRVWQLWSKAETALLALVVLAVLGAAAKASFSGGPEGELYGGLTSRSLEVGGHSDSRIPYHGVQLVAHHLSPYEPAGEKFFWPWSFSSRGPLAGLAAAPVVLATAGSPPLNKPDQAWEPFDREGFAAYRITVAALSALGLVAVFSLLRLVADERRALLGVGLLALAPFFWHELYFSWPKAVTAAWVLGAFALVWQQRAFLGGLALGAAYLWHPLALLSAPFVALWCLRDTGGGRWPGVGRAAVFSGGVLLVVAGWLALNHGHNSQEGFLRYFAQADEGLATWRSWPLSRWNNLANTLVPFYVLFFNSTHQSFGALGQHSDNWVLFFHQCWTAAPFAVGLVAWCALVSAFERGLTRNWNVALLGLIGPLAFLALYWGGASAGLMREAGQPLFLAGWVFLAWSGEMPAWSRRVIALFCAARAAEVLGMLFAPALLPASRHFSPDYFLNDCLWLAVAVAAVAATAWIATQALVAGTAHPARDPGLR